jgi:WD40 repeat protein
MRNVYRKQPGVYLLRIASGLLMVFSLALLPAFADPLAPPDIPAAQDKPQAVDLHGDPLPRGALQRLGTVRYRQESHIAAFAFAPDGKTFATADNTNDGVDSGVRLWDTATGKQMRSCGGTPLYVRQFAFAPDGKTVAAGCDRDVLFWDVASGKKLRQFEVPTDAVTCLAWSPDGKTIAVGDNLQGPNFLNSVRLLDPYTGKLVRVLNEHKSMVNVVVFFS